MPRMNERDRRAAIDAQITTLLGQAADPGLNASTGLVNILRAQLVAEMVRKHERVKVAWDSALAGLVAVLEQRIQDRLDAIDTEIARLEQLIADNQPDPRWRERKERCP